MTLDIRRGRPSASSMHRFAACPGSYLAEQAAGPELTKSDDASHGTRIHDALAGKIDSASLSVDEFTTYELCRNQTDALIGVYLGIPERVILEERIWSVGESFSGEPDIVAITGRRGFVGDYKSLRGEVAHATENYQLRTLAVLVFEKYDLDEIVAAIVQPLNGEPSVVVYTRDDLEQAAAEIYGLVEEVKRPGLPRIPDGNACKYCRAKTSCPEALKVAVAPPVANIPAGATPDNIAAVLTGPLLSVFLDRAKVADAVIEACREEAKRRLSEDPASVPGWSLEPGYEREKITNALAVFERFAAIGGTPEQFLEGVTVTKKGLKEATSKVTGKKGKSLTLVVDQITDGATETTQNQPSLVRVKGGAL